MNYRKYETVIAIRTDIMEDVIQQFHERLTQLVTKNKGYEIKFEVWGKRKLAYEIKLNKKAILIYYLYIGEAGITDEIERSLKFEDLALRFFTKKLADNVNPEDYNLTSEQKSNGIANI